jgi:hypothetical protein
LLAIVLVSLAVIFSDIFKKDRQAKATTIKSIVVLPFVNNTGTDQLASLIMAMLGLRTWGKGIPESKGLPGRGL